MLSETSGSATFFEDIQIGTSICGDEGTVEVLWLESNKLRYTYYLPNGNIAAHGELNCSNCNVVISTPANAGAENTIRPTHTGSWFDPATDGRGGFVNIAEQGGQMVLVIAWFDYNEDGSQMWLVGSSDPLAFEATNAIVPVQVTSTDGNGDVIKSDWGTFTFEFNSCDSGNLVIEPNNDGASQTVPLTRLTKIVGLSC